MKFAPLIWSGLRRRPVQSVLTALCIALGFLLLGLLDGVNASFERAIANARREFLVTSTRVRGGTPMPIAALDKIRAVPGVVEAAPRAYFMGAYREPGMQNTIAALATEPAAFFRLRPNFVVSPQALDALLDDRMGLLTTRAMLDWFGWKVGDAVTVRSDILRQNGSPDWTFHVVGTFDTPNSSQPAYFGVMHYAYLDEARVVNRGTAEVFYVRIADPTRAVSMAAAIDRIFANSPHETRTRSDQQRAQAQAKQLGDVRFFTHMIMGAVLFALTFLTANTVRQMLQGRRREFAVLKALGAGGPLVFALACAEALLLCLPPAAVGLLAARLGAPLVDAVRISVSPTVVAIGLGCAAALACLAALAPALSLARLSIADALKAR